MPLETPAAPALAPDGGYEKPLDTFLSFCLWGTVMSLVLSSLPLPWLAGIVVGSWVAGLAWIARILHRDVDVPFPSPTPVAEAEAVPADVGRVWAAAGPALEADGFVPMGRFRRETAAACVAWSAQYLRADGATWAGVQAVTDAYGTLVAGGAIRTMMTRMDDGEVVALSDDATPAPAMPVGHWMWHAAVSALRAAPSLTAAHDRQVALYRERHPGARPDPSIADIDAHIAETRRAYAADLAASGRMRVTAEGRMRMTWRGAVEGTLLNALPGLKPATVAQRLRERRAARALGLNAGRAPSWAGVAFSAAGVVLGIALAVLAFVTAHVIATWAGVGMLMARYHQSRGQLHPATTAGLMGGGALGMAGWFVAAMAHVYLNIATGIETLLLPWPFLNTVPTAVLFIGGVLLARTGLRGVDRALR